MRFVFETQGVIDAETEEEANALAEELVLAAKAKFGPGGTGIAGVSGVLAVLDVQTVVPKVSLPVGS